jgi:hypothetical protein
MRKVFIVMAGTKYYGDFGYGGSIRRPRVQSVTWDGTRAGRSCATEFVSREAALHVISQVSGPFGESLRVAEVSALPQY